MTKQLSHIGVFHYLSSPVVFQHGVFNNNRYSSQDEGQEEVSMNVVPCAVQFSVRGHKRVKIGLSFFFFALNLMVFLFCFIEWILSDLKKIHNFGLLGLRFSKKNCHVCQVSVVFLTNPIYLLFFWIHLPA